MPSRKIAALRPTLPVMEQSHADWFGMGEQGIAGIVSQSKPLMKERLVKITTTSKLGDT